MSKLFFLVELNFVCKNVITKFALQSHFKNIAVIWQLHLKTIYFIKMRNYLS